MQIILVYDNALLVLFDPQEGGFPEYLLDLLPEVSHPALPAVALDEVVEPRLGDLDVALDPGLRRLQPRHLGHLGNQVLLGDDQFFLGNVACKQ